MDPSSGAVINPLFCVPYPTDLAFKTKPLRKRYLATVDAAGNILFKTKHYWLGGFTQLRDAAGHTVFTMKPKFITLHGRWQAFRGDSMEAKDLVFSIKRSSFLQFYDEWFVYLAGNTEEENCDFRVTGSYRKKNYTIYKGDSSFVVAQFAKDHKLNLQLKHAFGATISANCDHSFVAALIVIFRMVYVRKSAASSHMRTVHHRA
ncbi:hypothetical protein IEQ34_000887 [Dendrobium chrysotoxum]|uniref:Protein LURP-one-related 15 n=1 Tax=Dendrobium chrysotoxum TaxID=161865 RepID=A0AAV7HBH6_DENCH|nr:hypothetical protein IEQ34_000887 [Dendrobium chrysotoxum]